MPRQPRTPTQQILTQRPPAATRYLLCLQQPKSITIEGETLVYRAAFQTGQVGVFNKKDVVWFFEDRYFAQERALVNRFAASGLAPLIERLHKAVGAPVNVQFDVPGMLATCVKKDARLTTARTLITRTKMTEKGIVAAKTTVCPQAPTPAIADPLIVWAIRSAACRPLYSRSPPAAARIVFDVDGLCQPPSGVAREQGRQVGTAP